MTEIWQRLEKHYSAAVAYYGEDSVFGVFHYGSWNYGTNLAESDVDTKCILVPNIRHLALKPFAVNHLHIDEEVCECMSIMHMVENWKKQNINFVEIMFTPYFKLNPMYFDFWSEQDDGKFAPYALDLEKSERVARYDVQKAVLSMSHQAINTLKRNPTDPKAIMNGVRMAASLFKLTTTKNSYINVMKADRKTANIRTGETILPEGYVDGLIMLFESMIKRAEGGEWAPDKKEQEEVNLLLDNFILDLINYRITNE